MAGRHNGGKGTWQDVSVAPQPRSARWRSTGRGRDSQIRNELEGTLIQLDSSLCDWLLPLLKGALQLLSSMLSNLMWVVIAVTDASSFLLFLSFKNTEPTPNTTSQPCVSLTSLNSSFCLWSVSLAKSSLPVSIVLNPRFDFLLNSLSCQLLKLGLIFIIEM